MNQWISGNRLHIVGWIWYGCNCVK